MCSGSSDRCSCDAAEGSWSAVAAATASGRFNCSRPSRASLLSTSSRNVFADGIHDDTATSCRLWLSKDVSMLKTFLHRVMPTVSAIAWLLCFDVFADGIHGVFYAGIHQSDVHAPADGHIVFRPLTRTRRVLCHRPAESQTGPSRGCPHPGQEPRIFRLLGQTWTKRHQANISTCSG